MADCWYAKPARKEKRSVGVCSCICFVIKGWLPEGGPSSLFVLVLKPKKFSMFNDTSDALGRKKDEAAADRFCFD